ncbi:type II toxin-antitoxin system Phd/YefM family antitoxin [Demequina sp.]|uniref:type II toxin-antitoxin system Phd/YefM family antitoxin n=1 Tax=Demequina sp. TaxID=2050685 RepID=UPI003D0C3828
MRSISVGELRQNPTEALAAVEAGESVVVTRHRRPIAKLVPVDRTPLTLIPARNPNGPRLSDRPNMPRRTYEETEALLAEMKEDR